MTFYYIRNKSTGSMARDDDGNPLFWASEYGWTTFDLADSFTSKNFDLPIDGEWVEDSEAHKIPTFTYLDRVLLNSDPDVWGTVVEMKGDNKVAVEWDDDVGHVSIMNAQEISHV